MSAHQSHREQPLSTILPPLIFGTATFNNQYNPDPYELDTDGMVEKALSLGIRAFDTSPYYGPSEELLGRALNYPAIRDEYPRDDYFLLTKVGRIAGDEFDYSTGWVRQSVQRSLKRLHTDYLDVVYCHDVEFVSGDEVLEAVRELRRIRDEDGSLLHVGITGYPVDVLCSLAERVLAETGEPLDIVMSYGNYTIQNTLLATHGLERLGKAGVEVIPNASVLGMGLIRRDGPPVGGQGDWRPSSSELRQAVKNASAFCDDHGETIEVVAIRWAIESWLQVGSIVGASGDPASGVPREQGGSTHADRQKLGVTVIGVSKAVELEETFRVWRSILDGRDDGEQTAAHAGRWQRAHEWSLVRKRAVELMRDGVQEALGEWRDQTWPSPSPGFVRKHRPSKE